MSSPAVTPLPSEASSLQTKHLYYDDTELFSNVARVIAQYVCANDGREVIVLDQTVMHPQGGGQPSDVGLISTADKGVGFKVEYVQKPKGAAYIEHVGQYSSDRRLSVGDEVHVEIDSERRMLHARLHSAGHLLDSALTNIGVSDLVPDKGYHFPDGAYVEYVGNIPVERRESVIATLNEEIQRLIKEASPVTVSCDPNGVRKVEVGGTQCPCGGTHVKNLADICGVIVTKIKKNKKNIKVSYLISDK